MIEYLKVFASKLIQFDLYSALFEAMKERTVMAQCELIADNIQA